MAATNNKSLTKIICTIGDASSSVEMLVELAQCGMSVARLNMSHGTHESHQATIDNIREAERRSGSTIGIAIDTKGPELRVCAKKDLAVQAGDEVLITNDAKEAGEMTVCIPFGGLLTLGEGTSIFVDDGHLALKVVGMHDKRLVTKAMGTHVLKSGKGVNIPGVPLNLPSLSEGDRSDVVFGLKNHVDFVFASFVSSDSDVIAIKELVGTGSHVPEVIAKIESVEGMRNLAAILEVADGVMVARGDLAVEIGHEKVFAAQKRISRLSLARGKVLVCATQMMESMTKSTIPTRAEVSDVGNAVLDGCDCVMLSGETASGDFPAQTVKMMRSVCIEAEKLKRMDSTCLSSVDEWSEVSSVDTITFDAHSIQEIDVFRFMHPNFCIYVSSDDHDLLRKLQVRKNCFALDTTTKDCSSNKNASTVDDANFIQKEGAQSTSSHEHSL